MASSPEANLVAAIEHRAPRIGRRGDLAQDRLARVAVEAMAAVRAPRERDAIADGDEPNTGADRLHDACSLVADHRRQAARLEPVHRLPVGVAEARCADPDADFARPGLRDVDRLDREPALRLAQDGRLDVHCGTVAEATARRRGVSERLSPRVRSAVGVRRPAAPARKPRSRRSSQ